MHVVRARTRIPGPFRRAPPSSRCCCLSVVRGGLKPTTRAPFPRLFSFTRLDSPCCWCGSEDDERDKHWGDTGTSHGAEPGPTAPSAAVQKRSASPTLEPELREGPRKEAGPSRSPLTPRTRTEADDSFPLWIIEPTRPHKPMRDGRQCSGTGSEDFQGSAIVKWKVLLSPRSRKKTFWCPRKQVSPVYPSLVSVRGSMSDRCDRKQSCDSCSRARWPRARRSSFIHPSAAGTRTPVPARSAVPLGPGSCTAGGLFRCSSRMINTREHYGMFVSEQPA